MTRLIIERLPVTLFLTAFAAVLAVLVAVPMAMLAALRRDSLVDGAIRTGFQIGLSMPVFYIGILMLTFFAARLHWFPVGGFGSTFGEALYHLFLPALTLAFSLSAVLMRNLRNGIIEVLNADYVDFARAKGLRNRLVLVRHVLRNALISTVTLFGLYIGTLLGGAVITETVFAIPGVGRLMIDSIYGRDYPVVQGLTLTLAILVSLVFLVTDIVQAMLDPRHRAGLDERLPAAGTACPVRRPASGRRRKSPLIGGLIMLVMLVCAFFPGAVAPFDPLAFDYNAIMQPPSLVHPFGTDNLGRDMLSRVIFAASIDLQIAIFSTVFPLLLGTVIGAVVGYRGGLIDALFGRLVDLSVTVPFLILVIAIVAVLGPGLFNLYVAVSAVGWVPYARLLRSEMMVQAKRDYAAAARAMGFGTTRIIFGHLLPNAVTPTIVYWMTDLALAILLGSSLGYLGLGAQPPTAEWGVLIADGKNFMTTAWWMSIFPGMAIVAAGLSFSLLGDTVAEWLRPK